MDPKINYLRSQIAGIDAQLAADKGKSTILNLLGNTNFTDTTAISVTGSFQVQ